MSVKEELRKKAGTVREMLWGIWDRPLLVKGAEYLIRAILCGVLAGAQLLGDHAPFALAMTAASGTGAGGAFALVGACFGYLALRGFTDALAYTAACILTFAVAFAFGDLNLYRQRWFMPAAAMVLGGVTGFVQRAGTFTQAREILFFVGELLLIAAGTYCYRLALSTWDRRGEEPLTARQLTGLLFLGCTLLISLGEVRPWGVISVGCAAGALVSILAAWKKGVSIGAVVGLTVGLTMELSAGQASNYAVAFALAGMLSGAVRKRGKLLTALVYILVNGALAFGRGNLSAELSGLYEVFVASVVFMALPERLISRMELQFGVKGDHQDREEWEKDGVKEKLEVTADAFRELCDGIRVTFRRVAPNDTDISQVFHRAANRVCVRCALRDRCWQAEYASTMNAVNDAMAPMVKRGRGEAEDFPLHFRTRCLNFQALLAALNEELTALRYRRQFQSRARESREAVCRQYGLFAHILDGMLRKMEERRIGDPRAERKAERYMASLGLEARVRVWHNGAGRPVLEVTGMQLDALKEEEQQSMLSQILQIPLGNADVKEQDGVTRIRWSQVEPLMAVAGVAARAKEGQTVSGDAGAWFKTEDGGVYVLLCDGMGSGYEARRESTLAIRLLEKFLRAGMEPEEALNTLNSALALRDDEESGFTTVDLLRLDLFTGEAGFYKLGAAPTYVRRKGAVSRLTGMTMPAGLNSGGGPDVSRVRLEVGDSIVMVSDGVVSPENDGWLKQMLAAYDGADPKSLATELISAGTEHEGETDDRTAVVLTVKAR